MQPDRAVRAYPVRVGSRLDGDGRSALVGRHAAGGVVAVLGAQPLAGLVDMGVDRVLGDAELAADLLGAEVLVDESEAFTLAAREKVDGRIRRP